MCARPNGVWPPASHALPWPRQSCIRTSVWAGRSVRPRWALGPLISLTFPNTGAVRARIAAARADDAGSLAQFDGTLLTALEETERALIRYARLRERIEILARTRDEAQRAARITLARQRDGRIDFLTVLDAQRTLASAETDLVAARRDATFAQVDLSARWAAAGQRS